MSQQFGSFGALESTRQSYPQLYSPKVQQYATSVLAQHDAFAGILDAVQSQLDDAFAGILDAVQSQLDSVFPTWTKNLLPDLMSPELLDSLARWAEQIKQEWPDNWEDSADFWADATRTMRRTGVPLVWVPRREIVVELMEADDAEAVLLLRREDILEDCLQSTSVVSGTPVAVLVAEIEEAVATARSGHWKPLQTYCATIFTTILQVHMRFKKFGCVKAEFQVDPDDMPYRLARLHLLGVCINKALTLSRGWDTEQPSDFNWHSTSHTLNPVQFTERNALVALMLVSAMVRELHQMQSNGVWDELPFVEPELVLG